jgi:hypothetical protein
MKHDPQHRSATTAVAPGGKVSSTDKNEDKFNRLVKLDDFTGSVK